MLYSSIWAHRGASAYAPENTIPAFMLAHKLGAEGIEFDVRMTKDGIPVICHDQKIDRTSNGTGFVTDLTLEELKQFDFGYADEFGGKFRDTKIPTLEEVYEAVKPTGMIINAELEFNELHVNMIPSVHELTLKYGLENTVIYSCFSPHLLEEMKRYDSNAFVAPL